MKKTSFILALFFAVVSALFAEEYTVAYVGGVVTAERAKVKKPLRRQETVREGDIISTGSSAFAALRTDDGTVIKVAADTVFEVKKLRSSESERVQTFSLTRGKILSSISKLKKPTLIDWYTPTAIAGIRGTIFILEVNDKSTTLYVTEGNVGFGKDVKNPAAKVGENQMAVLGKDDKKPEVRTMSRKDLDKALQGIPVKLVIENGGSDPTGGTGDLKDELRKNLRDQKTRQDQDREKYYQKSFWDSETGRVVRVGDTTYNVVERYRKTGDTVRYFSTTENRNNNRISIMDVNAYFKGGVPSLSSAVAGGDVRAPTTERLTVGGKLPGKRADLLEISVDNSTGSAVNSARISSYSDPNKVFQGSEFQTMTIGNEDYLILKDGSVEAYRFRIGTKVVDSTSGKELLFTPSTVNVNNLLKLLSSLGNAAVYMYWIPESSGTGTFYSGQIEIIVSAQYLPMILLNSLISF
ncbi:MAG: FecR domain-containing protein [Spirochaetia bacterium]|nr:FecR domain-containing protein [Spirochaetia bacterium]